MLVPTITIEEKLENLRNGIIDRLTEDFEKLRAIAEASYFNENNDEYARINAKADAIEKVVDEQGERLINIRTEDEVFALISIIGAIGAFDGALSEGTRFASNRVYDFIR